MARVLVPVESSPVLIRMRPVFEMTDENFFEFCQLNRDLRIERTAEGDVVIMPPAGGETGNRNAKLTSQVTNWTREDGTGVSFDSSTGYNLPNGATRAPDASWVRRSRLKNLTVKQKQRFLPLCPDFVVELRSPSDRLSDVKDKMEEYLDNGAELGWLLDPGSRRVYVYRPDSPLEVLDNPQQILGGPLLPGFVLDLREIWEPGF